MYAKTIIAWAVVVNSSVNQVTIGLKPGKGIVYGHRWHMCGNYLYNNTGSIA